MAIAQDSFNQTNTFPITFSDTRDEIVIINDGTADLLFTAGGMTFTLKPGEVFDEKVMPFQTLNVVATGSFRGYVREDL
jgi:hypothetical protein